MCSTPYCFGDCDECLDEQKAQQEREEEYWEMAASCPQKRDCNLVTVDVKTDKCTTCHKLFMY